MHALNKNQDALKTDQEVRAVKSRIHVSSYLRLVSWIYLPPSLDIHILKYTDLLKSLTPITGKFNSLQMNQKRRLFLGKEQLTNTDIIKISKRRIYRTKVLNNHSVIRNCVIVYVIRSFNVLWYLNYIFDTTYNIET